MIILLRLDRKKTRIKLNLKKHINLERVKKNMIPTSSLVFYEHCLYRTCINCIADFDNFSRLTGHLQEIEPIRCIAFSSIPPPSPTPLLINCSDYKRGVIKVRVQKKRFFSLFKFLNFTSFSPLWKNQNSVGKVFYSTDCKTFQSLTKSQFYPKELMFLQIFRLFGKP